MKTIKFSIFLLALVFSRSFVQADSFNAKTIPSTHNSHATVQHVNLPGYKILESKAIIIYEHQRPGGKLNLFKPIITYYFSVKGSDKVYLLTLQNLKNIYRDGPAFAVLDTYFRTDSDFLSYDQIHHEYRVNYYLSKVDRA